MNIKQEIIDFYNLTNNNLFPRKEQYLQSHDCNGKPLFLQTMSVTQQKKVTHNNKHIKVALEYSEPNGFPILKPYNGTIGYDYISYGKHYHHTGRGECVDFFCDDYIFEKACDWNLTRTTYRLKDFDCLMSPDYSLYVDASIQDNKAAIYKSRLAGAYWQYWGFNVIPTASWSDVDSFNYCFEGLPLHSVIAVCGVGVSWCSYSTRLWQYGMREIEQQLQPTTIIVYGSNLEVPGLQTPVTFIQDNISKRFRG